MNAKASGGNRGASAFAALMLATLAPAGAQLAGQLGVLDLTANDGINPATDAARAEGDSYRPVFVTSATTEATSSDTTTYNDNAFVQRVAASGATYPKLGNGLWKIVGSTTSR